MSKQQNVAINVNAINKLMLEIIDCSNNVKSIFNKIDDLFLETKSYYNCSSGDLLRSKYAVFNDNYNLIIKSILSYKNDLSNLKKKYAVNMDNLSHQIKRDASKLNAPQDYKERR